MSNILKIVAQNKQALFNYLIYERYEAGIVLTGSEVKSIRLGHVVLSDSYAAAQDQNELYLYNCYIDKYDKSNAFGNVTRNRRKLLLHRGEIKKITSKIKLKGYTAIALCMYFNKKNILKIELGIAQGKNLYDKRQNIKKIVWQRQQERLMRDKS